MSSFIRRLAAIRAALALSAMVCGASRAGGEPADQAQPGDARVKVAAVAMHSEMGDFRTNLKQIDAWAAKAQQAGAQIAVFPELCLTGALCKSNTTLDEAKPIVEQSLAEGVPRLVAICRQRQMTLVVGAMEPAADGKFSNAALVVGPAGVQAKFAKLWLPNNTEKRWFVAGRVLPVVHSQGFAFSLAICADIDHDEYFAAAAARGAEMMLMPIGGSGYGELVTESGDQKRQAEAHKSLHMEFLPSRARDHGLYVFYANQAGKSGNDWFPGLVLCLEPSGKLIAEHTPDEGMTVIEVSRAKIKASRAERKPVDVPELRNSAGEKVTVEVIGND